MFFDEAHIEVHSGDGGAGMSHFRREKYVPHGGPDGGNGGKGGDVVLMAVSTLNTLIRFSRQREFTAENGGRGGTSDKTGRGAPDVVIEVPRGTVIRDAKTMQVIADLVEEGQRVIVVHGGRGGRGNARFGSSAHQAPHLAEKGEPGEERKLALELKLIADVGIVGVPNAGKSTLLAAISKATPKIAAYPFTTLEPNLGVVTIDHRDFVVADIPGLIEGAHLGIGLGHAFLRHIQRTRILIHLLDGTAENPLADFNQINAELALFDEHLRRKPQVVVFNKMDMPEAIERWPDVQAELTKLGYETYSISGLAHQNTRELMNRILTLLDTVPEPEAVVETPVYRLGDDPTAFQISREDDGSFRVTGSRIERAAKMTYWEIDESSARFQRILDALGISEALEAEGVTPGDTVYIGDAELEWGE